MASASISRAAIVSPRRSALLRWMDYVIAVQVFVWMFVGLMLVLGTEKTVISQKILDDYRNSAAALAAAAGEVEIVRSR